MGVSNAERRMTGWKRASTHPALHVPELQLFALSNLRPTETGIAGAVIWVSAGEFCAVDRRHGPRIMVVLGASIAAERLKDAVAVLLADPPELLGRLPGKVRQQLVTFIVVNRDVLLLHRRGEIATRKMLDLLKRV